MALIINKSRSLKPKEGRVIKPISHIEKQSIDLVKTIAKQFGHQSKKQVIKKITYR